jgi:hypothetical protein
LMERVETAKEARENDEDGAFTEDQADMIAEWEEIADEKALNVPAMGRIAKGVSDLCKPQGEQ